MTRKECYEYIKAHKGTDNLIKQAEGKSYTNCSTALLEKWILTLVKKERAVVAPAKSTKTTKTPDYIKRLLEVLKNKKLLIKSEVEYILGDY